MNVRVFDLLSPGEENAITSKELETLTGWTERLIRKRIRHERLAGLPILSSGKGFFLPASGAELRRYARSIAHRAAAVAEIARAAERAVAEADGQAALEGWWRDG